MNVDDRSLESAGSATRIAWKPAIALLVLAPFIAETISGAMSMATFLSPAIFFPFVIFVYGIPILTLREVAVRRGFGLLAVWCLGMIYGLYNEGLLALTTFSPLDAPIDIYASYGVVGNVRVPFTIFISNWHATVSVILPVLLVHHLVPATAARPWLPLRVAWAAGSLCVALAIAGFFGVLREDGEYVPDVGLAVFDIIGLAFVAALLWLVANGLRGVLRVTSPGAGRLRWMPFVYGALYFAASSVVSFGLADAHVDWVVFVLYFLALWVAGLCMAVRHVNVTCEQAVLFALGIGMAAAVLAATFGNIVPAALFGACFAAMLARIARAARPRARDRPSRGS